MLSFCMLIISYIDDLTREFQLSTLITPLTTSDIRVGGGSTQDTQENPKPHGRLRPQDFQEVLVQLSLTPNLVAKLPYTNSSLEGQPLFLDGPLDRAVSLHLV